MSGRARDDRLEQFWREAVADCDGRAERPGPIAAAGACKKLASIPGDAPSTSATLSVLRYRNGRANQSSFPSASSWTRSSRSAYRPVWSCACR